MTRAGRLLPLALVAVVAAATGCVRGTAAGGRGWVEARTEHVLLRTDADAELAQGLARHLEELRGAFVRAAFSCAAGEDTPLEVVVLSDRDDYDAIAGAQTEGRLVPPQAAWPPMEPQVLLPLEGPHRLRAFAHELAHRLLSACMPSAPVWLHEGVASVFETVQVGDEQLLLGLPPYAFVDGDRFGTATLNGIEVTAVPRSRAVPLHTLVAMSPAELYAFDQPDRAAREARAAHYASAWSAAHALLLGSPETRRGFEDYVRAVARGAPAAAAFTERFDLDTFDARLARLRAEPTVPVLEVPHAAGPGAAAEVGPLAPADALALLASIWDWSTSDGRARATALLDRARSLDPGAPRAVLLAAAVALRGGDRRAAEAHLTEAEALAPDDPDVLLARIALLRELAGPAAAAPDAALPVLADRLLARATTSAHLATVAGVREAEGRCNEGLGLARRGAAMDPRCWRCHLVAALCLAELGRLDEVEAEIRAALGAAPHGVEPALAPLLELLRLRPRE